MRSFLIGIFIFVLTACGGGGGGGGPRSEVYPETTIGTVPESLRSSAFPVAGKRGNVAIRHGRRNDGVDDSIIRQYLSEYMGQRFENAPVVRFAGSVGSEDIERTRKAVDLINAALPQDSKMRITLAPADSLYGNVSSDGLYYRSGNEEPGTIYIEFIPDTRYHNSGESWGTGWSLGAFSYALISDAYTSRGDTRAIRLLAHEIIHTIGIDYHIPTSLYSIMHATITEHHPETILTPADRDALLAIYGKLEPGETVDNLDPWESQSTNIIGETPHVQFGVSIRNGFTDTWAMGVTPETDLADNSALSGSVTWIGALLGFTPQAEAVAGDARINVDLDALAGSADFTGLESWASGLAPGDVGSGVQWLDGDLGYAIVVRGNTFSKIGGDDGRLMGIFVGRQHEGAAGTLERDDLTAAFGGER